MAAIRRIGPASSRQLRQGSVRVHRNSPDATAAPAPINAPLTTESFTDLDVVWADTVETAAVESSNQKTTIHETGLPLARIIDPLHPKVQRPCNRARRLYC